MTGRRRVLALLLVGAWTLVPGHAEAGPKTVRRNDPLAAPLQLRIRKAIDKGVAYLRAEPLFEVPSDLQADMVELFESFRYQEAALFTWVLRRAGLAADHADLAPPLTHLRQRAPRTALEASFLLLALTAKPFGDGDLGGASEAPKTDDDPPVGAVRAEDRPMVDAALKQLLSLQFKTKSSQDEFDDAGGWSGANTRRTRQTVDIGGTYVALLALESCVRAGLSVPSQVFLDALSLLLRWQARTGTSTTLLLNEVRGAERTEWSTSARARGFGFAGALSDEPTGTDTAGAAVGLTICHDLLQEQAAYTPDLRKKTQAAILDALAWIQSNYSITKCPSKERGAAVRKDTAELFHYEWLQALARLYIHLRMRFVGSHDWYKEGAEMLLSRQGTTGQWGDTGSEHCFAILFVMRASIPSLVTAITPGDEAPPK